MFAMNRKKLVHMHGQRFVRAVMEKTLREAGFTSIDGEDVHWCRVVDNSIIQTVYFYVQETTLPACPMIGYASHPLFLIPVFPRSFYIYGITSGLEVFNLGKPLTKLCANKFSYSDDIWVSCPDDNYCGGDILDEIIKLLDSIRTPEDCYQMHKSLYLYRLKRDPRYKPYHSASFEFIAEAVYWNDSEVLGFGEMRVNEWIAQLKANQAQRHLTKYEEKQLEELEKLRKAISDGERDTYLLFLKENEKKTIQMLKRRTGIVINQNRV